MREIPLSQGKVAIVDDEDYEALNAFKWHITGSGYAARNTSRKEGKSRILKMHISLLAPPVGFVTDHANGDKLDNRRANLRTCTQRQNIWNSNTPKTNTSGFKGVSWCKTKKRWYAAMGYGSARTMLGYYRTAEEAAGIYITAALEFHGEFARL